MIQNSYIGLLDKDTIIINHPITKKEIRLYRVIALQDIMLDQYDVDKKSQHEQAERQLQEIVSRLEKLKYENDNITEVLSRLPDDSNRKPELQKQQNQLISEIATIELQNSRLFEICNNKDYESTFIKKHTIGGYVESLDNLDPNLPVWVGNKSRVFDSAKILNGSIVVDNALVFGNSSVVCSKIANYSRVHGNCFIEQSKLLDLCEVKGDSKVKNSILQNSCMVFEQATVIDSILSIGSCVRGKAYLKSSMLTDTAQVQGSARILNCSLSGRSVISIGEYQDDSFHEVSDLLYEVYDSKLDYIQEVTVKYNNVAYKGWAEIIPGKNRAILFKTKDLQHPVKTIGGMDITVTPQDLYGRDKF